MAIFDEPPPARKSAHEIGADLTLLSVDELNERITLLSAEIERLKAEISRKGDSRETAESFFR